MIPGLLKTDNHIEIFYDHQSEKSYFITAGETKPVEEADSLLIDFLELQMKSCKEIYSFIKSKTSVLQKQIELFCKMVFSQMDSVPDIDLSTGTVNFEQNVQFSSREKVFIKHVCDGLTDKQIAYEMGIAPYTAQTYRQNIMNKLGVPSKLGIAVYAIKSQLI